MVKDCLCGTILESRATFNPTSPSGRNRHRFRRRGQFPGGNPLDQSTTAVPVIHQHLRVRFHDPAHRGRQHRLTGVGDAHQANPSNPRSVRLRGHQPQRFACGAAPAFARPFPADIHLIQLHGASQTIPLCVYLWLMSAFCFCLRVDKSHFSISAFDFGASPVFVRPSRLR